MQKDGSVIVGVFHNEPILLPKFFGVYIKYKKTQLPKLVQWKMLGAGEYVIGLEPCNAGVLGRDETEKRGELKYLQPYELRKHELEIGVIDDKLQNYFQNIFE